MLVEDILFRPPWRPGRKPLVRWLEEAETNFL